MMMKWSRRLAGTMAAVVCMGAVSGIPAQAEETEAARGRYLESDATVPEGVFPRDIERMEDGSLSLIGQMTGESTSNYVVYNSTDGGASWKEQYTIAYGDETAYWSDVKLSPKGGGAAIVMEESDSASAAQEDGMFEMKYTFVSFDASGSQQETEFAGDDLHMLEFTQEGELTALTYSSGALLLNPETGETLSEIAGTQANMLGICADEALLMTDEEVQRYDIHTGEPKTRDEALNDALYAAGDAQSGKAVYMQTTAYGYPILFAQDEEGRLYYCTGNGIFSHMMDGNVVEQVVDGTLVSLASPSVAMQAMAVCGQTFYVLMTEDGMTGKLLKYEYDPDMASVPERELTVYSLTENESVRQAIVTFQKKYPDTYVNYMTGMSGADGVTAADALRTLNTDILAGNGPDVLLLDGMSVDTYASQGLLADLTEVVKEVEDKDGLIENIVDTYRKDEQLVAVPIRFGIEMAAGLTQQYPLDGTFESLEALAAQPGVLDPFDIANMAQLLYPVCAGSWVKEDETIDQEKLAEYVNGIKRISDAYRAQASPEDLEKLTAYENGEYGQWEDMAAYAEIDGLSAGTMELLGGMSKMRIGALGGLISYAGILSVETEEGPATAELLSMQQENVFYPSGVLSILNTSDEQERAGEFVAHLLSGETQDGEGYGFPVNRASFEKLLTEKQFEEGAFGATSSKTDGDMIELVYEWPTEEEMDALRKMVDSLTTCADTERVKRETVTAEVRRCMSGEITADEAVNSIMQKLNLYLAE
ncbi:MAG: ABC transporter substrate-binding protein [Lachnospiraceae bacterium]|nr:ABC transporter substrate-binding protein [Lachnospiraceae bacterium]